jgi:molecular chaperone GrpE
MSEEEEQKSASNEREAHAADQPTTDTELDEVSTLQEEIERWKSESEHHLDQWQRTAANLENYRKRVEKERGELLKLGQSTLLVQLLPVLDDLERAFLTLPASLQGLTWVDGMALIERKLKLMLEQQGLKEIEALGKPFDPAIHQSILTEDTTEHPDGQILAVLQKGYTFHDKVLRPTMVKVAQNAASAEQSAATPGPDEQGGSRAEGQSADGA